MDGPFQEGDWVVMHGMVNSAMNGQVGLLERFDDESGRWLVDLALAETVAQRRQLKEAS